MFTNTLRLFATIMSTLDNEKKSAMSMLHFAFSKKPGILSPFIGCATSKKEKKHHASKTDKETNDIHKMSPLMVDDEDADAIAIEDPAIDQNDTCREMDDFENVAKSNSVQVTGTSANLSQFLQSTLFSQASQKTLMSTTNVMTHWLT